MNSNHQVVSGSPHIYTNDTTQKIMMHVLIALFPTLIASSIIHGPRAILVSAVCVAFSVLFEWVFEKACGRPSTISDLSAAVTGMMLAYNLPVSVPLWQAVFGCLVAIVVIKQLFGGIGKNFANPAITARIVMLLAFSGSMTNWIYRVDAVSSATPLKMLAEGQIPSLWTRLIGNLCGCIGETCALTILLGMFYMIWKRVITWHEPVSLVATVFVLMWILGEDPLRQVLSGGLLMCAVFMATDYVTTPSSPAGRVIFGIGTGIITVLIRKYGTLPEGVSFGILFMNILTPYIDRWTRTKPFGGVDA